MARPYRCSYCQEYGHSRSHHFGSAPYNSRLAPANAYNREDVWQDEKYGVPLVPFVECPACDGFGWEPQEALDPISEVPVKPIVICRTCHGTGELNR